MLGTLKPVDFHCIDKKHWDFFSEYLFIFQVCNYIRGNLNFWVNYPFKHVMKAEMLHTPYMDPLDNRFD